MISTKFLSYSLHSPHAAIHFKPCFRHQHKFLRHIYFEINLHLQSTNFSLDSGACCMSVLIDFNTLPTNVHLYSAGFKQCRLKYLYWQIWRCTYNGVEIHCTLCRRQSFRFYITAHVATACINLVYRKLASKITSSQYLTFNLIWSHRFV